MSLNLKLVITTLMTLVIKVLPTLVVTIVKVLKTVKFFFPIQKFISTTVQFFFLLSLLSHLGKDISQEVEPLFNFTTRILLLTIGAFVGFIRIVLYILSVHYIEKYNLYEKYSH